ncbi:pyridoxamine 5'-phosphate oxidase family protein [Streptomyces sp. NPDC005046]
MHAVLCRDHLCHLGFVRDGAPVVLPSLCARVGERLHMLGSPGSRPPRSAGEATRLAARLTVADTDGLGPARSAVHHSIHSRSVVTQGVDRDPSVTAPAHLTAR